MKNRVVIITCDHGPVFSAPSYYIHIRSMSQKGFTLIELVLAVVIVAILAAVALPRFSSTALQAQIAAHQGFVGTWRSAVNIMHTAWIAQGAPSSPGSTSVITLEGYNATVNEYGWRTRGGMTTTATASGCVDVITYSSGNFLHNPPQIVTSGGSCTRDPCYVSSASSSTCIYTLQNGTQGAFVPTLQMTYDIVSGAITG